MRRSIAGLALVAILAGASVAVAAGREEAGTADGLTVFAAASLGDVTEALRSAWEAVEPDAPIALSVAGSDTLATQIAEGARADVFLSADVEHPLELVAAGHARSPVVPFARAPLAVATAAGADIVDVDALARAGTRVAAAGATVPISRYADALVAALAATRADPAAFRAALEANVVTREDNVRAALAKVELGEADAAIVYATDLRPGAAARALPLPDGVRVTATYGAVVTSEHPAADRFLAWLRGPEARAILAAAGFEPPDP